MCPLAILYHYTKTWSLGSIFQHWALWPSPPLRVYGLDRRQVDFEVEVAPGDPEFPFCSKRCRLIDLGHWLGENYKFDSPPDKQEEGPAATEDEQVLP